MTKWNWLVSIWLIVFLLHSNISGCSASIQFDKVETEIGKTSPPGESTPVKRISNPISSKLQQNLRAPLNRPRRDHQYATYKVPKNHNVLVDYGWTPRQLSSFATTNLLGQGPPPSEYPYPAGGGGLIAGAEEDDNVVAAGGHGHSQHGHGWGWGHSQGHQKYKKSEVNSSAVGMLGFLGLLALVQNVLRQMNGGLGGGLGGGGGIGGGGGGGVGGGGVGGGGVGGGGKRSIRSVRDTFGQASSGLYETTATIVPYLLNLNQIREGEWPLNCSSYQVCMLSQAASQGMTGNNEKQLIKKVLTSVIGEMLVPLTRHSKKSKGDLRREIDWAANVGLKWEKCDKYFKECKLEK